MGAPLPFLHALRMVVRVAAVAATALAASTAVMAMQITRTVACLYCPTERFRGQAGESTRSHTRNSIKNGHGNGGGDDACHKDRGMPISSSNITKGSRERALDNTFAQAQRVGEQVA